MADFPINFSQIRNTPYVLNFIQFGQAYITHHEFLGIVAGASVYLHANIGNRLFHLLSRITQINERGPLVVSLWENATFTDGVTPMNMPPRGLDRRIGALNPAQTAILVNPTAVNTAGATLIARETLYSAGNSPNSLAVADFERILPANSRYLLQLNNAGNQTLNATVGITFYESEN